MQTAAHIELAVWQTTMHAEGVDPHSPEEFRGYVGLKLQTTELLKRFRGCAANCPMVISEQICEVANNVEQGIETRNLAAHGAFFWENQSQGILGAAHYFARGKGKSRELFEVKQTVSRQMVEETIQVANKLFQDVVALRDRVIDWRYPHGRPELADNLPTDEASIWRSFD